MAYDDDDDENSESSDGGYGIKGSYMPADDSDDGYLGAIHFMQLISTSTAPTTARDPSKQPETFNTKSAPAIAIISNLEKLKNVNKSLPVYHMQPESTDLPIYDAKLNSSTLA